MATLNRFDRWTGWALPALVGVTPLVVVYAFVSPLVGQTYFLEFATWALLLAHGLAWTMGWRALPARPALPGWLAVALGVAVGLSLFASRSPFFSLRQCLLPASGFLLLGMMVIHPARRQVLGRVSLTLLLVAGLLSAYGILQYFGFEFLKYGPQVQKNKVIATIGHPNYLGSVLGPIVFIVLSVALTRRRAAWTLGGGALVLVILLCIVLAQTRGVWLGLAVGFGALLALGARYGLRHRLGLRLMRGVAAGLLLAAIVLAAMIVYLLPKLHAGIDLRDRLSSDREIKSRLYYWRAAVDLAYEKPVFGQGYGMFDPRFWEYALEQQKSPMGPFYYDMMPAIAWRTPGHVHNEYLEVFCEQGFVGLTALLALLGFFLYYGYRAIMVQAEARRAIEALCIYCAFLVTLVDALFAFPWRLPVSLLVFMVLLAWMWEFIYPQAAETA